MIPTPAEKPARERSPRALWQIIAAVLGQPVMRSVEKKGTPDERDEPDDGDNQGATDLSDLYPT